MLTLQDRMNEVFPQPQHRGLQAKIASLCKVRPASVSAWFNLPEKVSSISRANAETLCSHFDLKVTAAWLAEGVGDKYSTTTQKPVDGPVYLTGVQPPASAENAGLTHTLNSLADQLAQLEPATRAAAGGLLSALAQQPDNPNLLASLTALLKPAAFAEKMRKSA